MYPGEQLVWQGNPTWRATLSFYVKGIAVAAALLVLGFVVDWAGPDGWRWYGILAFLVVSALVVIGGWLFRRFTVYTITSRRLHVKQGILSKRETSTSVDRIQNVTVTQSPIDRIFKTGTVDFDTASDDPADTFRFVGIDHPQQVRMGLERVREEQRAAAAPGGQPPGGL
jgi:uncharacterized membrane protein YdbT with pleckstrin-like domain